MTVAIGAVLGLLLAAGLAERLLRDAAHRAVPVRVHVNGTRGKSTVTRLVAAALRAHGVPALAKVTGTEPRLLLPDGSERTVRRPGPASIREELRLLLAARRLGASAVVVECMAIRPELQWTAEQAMVRATVGVVTNVRSDHTEVMGESLEEIAASLASTVPRDGTLVLGEPAFVELFAARAAELGTRVVVADPVPAGATWLEEDVATALAVTRLLGVPDAVARPAMEAAAPDPGASREHVARIGGREVALLDARAANDPESFARLCAASPLLASNGPRVAVFNHRHDRPDRLRLFAPVLAALPGTEVVVTGDRPPLTLARAVRRAMDGTGARGGRGAATAAGGPRLRFVPVRRLEEALATADADAVVLCGNTRGLPVEALVARGAAVE